MMRLIIGCVVIFLIFSVVSPYPADNKISYDGYKVYKILIKNEEQRNFINQLAMRYKEEISIWHQAIQSIDIMVNPEMQVYFQNITISKGIEHNEMISNLQSIIDVEQTSFKSLDDSPTFIWNRYYNLSEIEWFLDDILTKYPLVTEGFTLAKSYEGRNVRGIKISYKSGNPGVFIESNIHAREWITSATSTWFINELLTSNKTDVRNLAENYDWYIVPVLNVDGFVYSHEKDRLWRKTRQPVSHSPCIGTDGNRNFDSHWMANGGASADPCDWDYAGPYAFSEPEMKGLADFLVVNKQKINILLAFHSYSQVLLSPYGHTNEELPPNIEDLMQVAKAYAKAVATLPYKTPYTYGTSAGDMYLASGATIEYAYNEVDIKITYTLEMRDTGKYGFVLPPIHILPNCEETMTGMLALINEAQTLNYMEPKY